MTKRKVVFRLEEVEKEGIEGFGRGFIMRNLVGPRTCGAENIRFGYNIFPSKSGTGIHRHPGEEAFYILKGEGFLRVEGEKHPFRPGCFMYIPSDVEHQTVNTGEEELHYLFVVSPPFDPSENVVIEPFSEKHLKE
jgi:quercetin dioxygenase-like cupin family protein